MRSPVWLARLAVAAVILTTGAGACVAQEAVAAFYRGKTLRVINPFAETGLYALVTQLFAEHLPRFLPGEPRARAEFMPGGGGLQAANYLYVAAPRDGTVLGPFYDAMPTTQALALDDLVKFDARRFTVLGSINRGETGLIAVLKRSGIASIADAREKVAVLGATGAAAAQYIVPMAVNRMLGTRFKLIPGYKTVNDAFLAMETGELDGLFTNFNTIVESRPQWVAEKRFNWLAQSADRADPDFPDAPLLQDLATDAATKDALRFLAMSRAPGKIIIAPPDVPADRAAALRAALAATLRDPAFLAAIGKLNQKVDPRDASEAMDVIRQTVDTNPATLARIRDLMRATQ